MGRIFSENSRLLVKILLAALGLCAQGVDAVARGIESIQIQIEVQDESGNPIPHATVWRTQDPCGIEGRDKVKTGDSCFNGEDLRRTATRLIETFEYAASYAAPAPFAAIAMPVAVDGNGRFIDSGDSSERYWGLRQPLVKNLNVWFAFLKQGYEPAFASVEISPDKNEYRGKVIMKADPRWPRRASENREAFERIRYELSDRRRNERVTLENAVRLDRHKDQLLQLARAAEAAGENELAARVYWRLLFMPSIHTSQTAEGIKLHGYHAGGGGLDRTGYWGRSQLLDPLSPFHSHDVAMKVLPESLKRKIEPPNEDEGIVLERFAAARGAEIQSNLSRMWPDHILLYAGVLKRIDKFDATYAWYREYEKIEPKYEGFPTFYRLLRRAMNSRKVPVPPEWNLP